jgi:hypothetical protein
MWDTGKLEKKLGNDAAANAIFVDLADCKNPFRLNALEELAKHYEHRERNYGVALEFTLNALEHGTSEALRKRHDRLRQRLAKRAANGRLL